MQRVLTLLLTLTPITAATAPPEATDGAEQRSPIGTAVYVGDDVIYDYDPTPRLDVESTTVSRARFPAVDIHCHWTDRVDPEALLEAMDERNVRRAVNLSGGWGEQLDRVLDLFHSVAPDRFVIFCNIDFSRIDEPDFGTSMAAFLADAKVRGVRGLKIFKTLGLTVRDGSGAIVPIDDRRLDPIWMACGELGMPVLIHTADPEAFFDPINRDNERWMQLRRHPDWSFHGADFPSRKTLFAQRSRMMRRHPKTMFIGAHVGSQAGDLDEAARVLDAHPNFHLDISGRVGELGRQPYGARRFLVAYQDRLLFGTDRYPGRPDQPRYRIYFRFLETDDEYFRYYEHPFPPAGDWRIYGVFLPDETLRRIYGENADRLLGFEPGE